MGIFGDLFKKYVHAQVVSDTDGSFEVYIDPAVFANMQFIVYGNNVFRIRSVLALNKCEDDFDAIIHVYHESSYTAFFNEE